MYSFLATKFPPVLYLNRTCASIPDSNSSDAKREVSNAPLIEIRPQCIDRQAGLAPPISLIGGRSLFRRCVCPPPKSIFLAGAICYGRERPSSLIFLSKAASSLAMSGCSAAGHVLRTHNSSIFNLTDLLQ